MDKVKPALRETAADVSRDDSVLAAARQIAARLLVAESDPRKMAQGLLDMPAAGYLAELGLVGDDIPDSLDGKARLFRDFMQRLQRRLRPLARGEDLRVEPFDSNLEHVAGMLGLDQAECQVLRFGALMSLCSLLRDVFDSGRSGHSNWERQRQLRSLFGIDTGTLASLFNRRSRLVQLGLLEYADLDLNVGEHLARALCADEFEPMQMLAHKARLAGVGGLEMRDFDHLPDLPRVLRHLRNSLAQRRAGVNVLIYGPPGTGKTELVKCIAADLECRLWDVPSADDDGDMREGSRRANTYALVQRLLQRDGRSLVMFDEVEDVFGSGMSLLHLFGGGGVRNTSKGWINEQLEHNPVPTFWLSNDIRAMDPAHIRRFDEVLELRAPGRVVRERIVARHLPGDLVSAECRSRLATIEGLPPAQVERTGRVLAALADNSVAERDQAALRLMENSLRAMGIAEKLPQPVLPVHYDPTALNADADLEQVVDLLADGEGARLLLYGPPGTGKTAFAHYLGQRLDRHVLVRRLSDLLDMYVGGTERNIAQAFRDARSENPILLLDEADSLLRSREGARQSWEVSQVNEMLTQMEQYDGLFIASTNLMGDLDPASLRRFDFKLRFDCLRREQRLVMFQRLCRDLLRPAAGDNVGEAGRRHKEKASARSDSEGVVDAGSPGIDQVHLDRVAALDRLTPGDFATVRRQLGRGRNPVSVGTVVERLVAEVAIKPGASRRRIGFHPD